MAPIFIKIDDDLFSINLSIEMPPKTKTAKAAKAVKAIKTKVKPEKKLLPAPGENEPLYKFYVSLYRQKPKSEMAIKWLIDHSLGHIVMDISGLKL